jgi:hypothetical protein
MIKLLFFLFTILIVNAQYCMANHFSLKLSSKFLKIVSRTASIALVTSSLNPLVSFAFGPSELPLKITSYKAVELCNGQKPIMPGMKAALGLYPVCIEVEADIVNNVKNDKKLTDVGVYGFVKENEAGNSVLPNNPDFKSDSGQYAMIASVLPDSTHVVYQFVAAVSADPAKNPLPPLSFMNTKAISYPGGEKFKPLGECEIDPRAEGCNDSEDSDNE